MSYELPRRMLGRTGMEVSRIGFGGILVKGAQERQAAELVAESVERGVNYFDVAPSYGDAELKLGPALKPFRDKVFLACKTVERDAAGARKDLEGSLKRLGTDHFDVYQLHALTDVEEDVKAVMAKGGAMEVVREAKKQGLVRNIGFSAHSPEAALAAMAEFDFDTIMYPVNFGLHFQKDFVGAVLAEAKRRQMGVIGIKAIAMRKRPKDQVERPCPKCWYEPIRDAELARLALSWAYEQGIDLALPPCEEECFRLCLKVLPDCGPLSVEELAWMEKRAAELEPIFPM
ncbi:MAG: aldo/keto reductase [Sedimentisphaerales bacterium]|nr:aldo/keto reductase [Sedimentisphaerales bacterium]